MAKVYTSRQDEDTIELVKRKGLLAEGPKWTILRLALALSLKQPDPPEESYDHLEDGRGGEYALDQLTGRGQGESEGFIDAFCAVLSAYHGEDLFAEDGERYVLWLQRHMRRGLREIRTSWRESHDFHEYLLQELFSAPGNGNDSSWAESPEAIRRALQEVGVQAEILERLEGPRVSRYRLRLPDVEDFSQLERSLETLAFALGLGRRGVFLSPTDEPKTVILDVPRPPEEWKPVTVDALRNWVQNTGSEMVLPVLVGVDVVGQALQFDLATAPHLLVGGTTGSGKSVCLHSLILSLCLTRTPEQVRFVLIDPKRVEFSAYTALAHLEQAVITEGAEAVDALNALVKIMEEREVQLAQAGARHIGELAEGIRPARLVVVVEELADLLTQTPAAEEALIRLAQKARSSGIHLILATQRPDAKTFSGLLRSNVPSRVALTVQKSSESKIILDEIGAEKLLGRGDMLVKWLGNETVRAHGVFLDVAEIGQFVRQTKAGR